ncbi:MAG TPA: hypothetical protein VMX95_03010 [Thermodesulfobacteriota bacterium]|nr:hypothetical protein [Thermodesulfobacteriota bacterium]
MSKGRIINHQEYEQEENTPGAGHPCPVPWGKTRENRTFSRDVSANGERYGLRIEPDEVNVNARKHYGRGCIHRLLYHRTECRAGLRVSLLGAG